MDERTTTMGAQSSRPLRFADRGLVQEGNPNLISVAPHHLGPQCDALLAHQEIKTAREDGGARKYESGAILGHVSDQAIHNGIISIKANRCAKIRPPALCFASIKHDQRSRFETFWPINGLFSNLRTVAVDALDIVGVA